MTNTTNTKSQHVLTHAAPTRILQAEGKEPPTEFLLLPFGEIQIERAVGDESFVFTRRHAENAVAWFNRVRRMLAIDYEHQSIDRYNTRPDGLRPAAGWIGGLELRDDGLYAVNVSWTPRAAELLRGGEYRYFSPVIYWSDADHTDLAALGPVALTNDPAMHGLQPLAASRTATAEPESVPAEPDPAQPAPEETATTTDQTDAAPDDAPPNDDAEVEFVDAAPDLATQLAAAQDELAQLRSELSNQRADQFIEQGLRLGKIVESTRADWRADYLRAPEEAERKLTRAPVVLPPGRVTAPAPREQLLAGARRNGALSQLDGATAGPEPEDYAAYSRAVAAGQVRTATN